MKLKRGWDKMTKNVAIGALFFALGAVLFAQSEEDFIARMNNSEGVVGVTISDYTGKKKDIVIPGTIGGKPVTVIGHQAFYKKGLTGVDIPSTVTMIGPEAFARNKITRITLPTKLRELGENAFDASIMVKVNQLCEVGSVATPATTLQPIVVTQALTAANIKAPATKIISPPETEESAQAQPGMSESSDFLPQPKAIDTYDVNIYDFDDGTKELQFGTVDIGNKANVPLKYTTRAAAARQVDAPPRHAGEGKSEPLAERTRDQQNVTLYPSGVVGIDYPVEDIFPIVYGGLGSTGAPPDSTGGKPTNWRENARYTGSYYSEDSRREEYDANDNYAQGNWERYGWGANAFASAQGYDTNRGYPTTAARNTIVPGSEEFVMRVDGNRGAPNAGIIDSYSGHYSSIALPGKVNNVPVRVIGRAVFQDKQISEVYIPDGITGIGDAAFAGNYLTRVFIPDSVTAIGYQAFTGNPLNEISIGKDVNIRDDTFPGDFWRTYVQNDKAAGRYVNNDGAWVYTGM